MNLLGTHALITFVYSYCDFSLHIVATGVSPCLLIPFLYVIFVNVISTDSLCMSCIHYFFFFPVLVNSLSCFLTPNFISRRSTPFLSYSLLTLLSFHITCLCLAFILVYWCTIILVLFYLFWSFHVFIFIFVVCDITPNCVTLLVSLVLVFDGITTYSIFPIWLILILLIFYICLFFNTFSSSPFLVMLASSYFPWVDTISKSSPCCLASAWSVIGIPGIHLTIE